MKTVLIVMESLGMWTDDVTLPILKLLEVGMTILVKRVHIAVALNVYFEKSDIYEDDHKFFDLYT